MELLAAIVDFFLHLDLHLHALAAAYDHWLYVLIFLIIFTETGLVVTPFLPGDSLLFAAGALAAAGGLELGWLLPLLFLASASGDMLNYWFGRQAGERAFDGRFRVLKPAHLERARQFYDRHGDRAILLGRFLPLVRTFIPFVGGMSGMPFSRFWRFNTLGAAIWVTLFLLGGYFFGAIPLVRSNFHLLLPAILLLSVAPLGFELLWANGMRWRRRRMRGARR